MQTKEIDILFSFLCFSFQNHTQIVCESRGRMNDTFQFSLAISHYYSERCTTTIIFSFHRCSFVPFRLRRTSPELLAIPTTKRVPVYRLNVRACVRCVCAQLFYHSTLAFVSVVVARRERERATFL